MIYSKEELKTFNNPIISGFYPDPSICRVKEDYYLVHSTFEYFPGVPVFQSKDLVHWRKIGYCLTRKSQLNLDNMRASGGIFAPTIRYHDGIFYMVTTLVDGGGNFYVTAKDAAGPWSEPVWLDEEGMDPSLFFDDNGKVYYTRHAGAGDGYIAQGVLDLRTGKLEGQLKEIWRGTGGIWPEGPHLYKIKGKYYIMIAEGGTSYGHMETIARSESPWGPFTAHPDNPILTHKDKPDHPFQALGHADMVKTPDGWWMVCLGIRPQSGNFHHLGRETFLTPVNWTKDGWPIIAGKGIGQTMSRPGLHQYNWKQETARDDFTKEQLNLHWNFLRNPYAENYSLTERPGYLRLWGSAITMREQDSPTFVGCRQTHLACSASTQLEFNPKHENEEAGLVLRGNEKNHYQIGITRYLNQRHVFIRRVQDNLLIEQAGFKVPGREAVILTVEAQPAGYRFFYKVASGSRKTLGTATTKDISVESIGGFTGVYIGLYATGNGRKNSVPADFDWFEYNTFGK